MRASDIASALHIMRMRLRASGIGIAYDVFVYEMMSRMMRASGIDVYADHLCRYMPLQAR